MTGLEVTCRWSRLDGVAPDRFDFLLSESDRARASGFRRERDSRRFVAARGLLYTVLGEALATDPASVELAIGPNGKPQLADERAPLRFNLSHSGGIALVALCDGREVGVDVERVRGDLSIDAIAQRHLPRETVLEIERLPPGQRQRAFFRAWVRLEARVKAHAGGLALLDSGHQLDGWPVIDLDLTDGYAAAVAVAGAPPERVDTGEIRLDSADRVPRPLTV